MDRTEWTDARIGDAIHDLRRRVDALDGTDRRLALVEQGIGTLQTEQAQGFTDCRSAISELAHAFAERAKARETERKAREADRKADRRWQLGAVFTAAGLIIAAIAILVPLLTGPAG